MTLTAAILAGGQSRRMGRDKAALEWGGVSLLERTARLCREANLPVIVVGREMPDGWPLPDVQFVEDITPQLGPLGGLRTALAQTKSPVLALACDLPLLTRDALNWLSGHAVAEHGLAVVNGGEIEPLFSLYAPACLPLIETRLAENRFSLRGLIAAGQISHVDAPDWVAAQLANVNTPEDWARICAERSRAVLAAPGNGAGTGAKNA